MPEQPPTPCPGGQEEVAKLLVESMLPEWVKREFASADGAIAGAAAESRKILDEWNTETVHHLLSVLNDAGYRLEHKFIVRKLDD